MGRFHKLLALTLVTIGLIPAARAQVAIDSLVVQGYMKRAGGLPVTDSTGPGYTIAVGVLQNGTYIWGKSFTTTVTDGLFSVTLSGVGGDLTSGAANCPALMKQNWSAGGLNRTLNPALLIAQGAGDVTVHFCAVSTIDGAQPEFNVTLKSVATAYVAALAKNVVDASLGVVAFAAGETHSTSPGAAANGKLALLDATGKFDASFIPDLPSSIITTGQVGLGNGGTGSTDGSITGTGNITYQSASGSTTNIGSTGAGSVLALRGGTGGITAAVTGTTGDVSLIAGTTSGSVTITSGSSGNIQLNAGTTGKVRVTNGTGIELVNGSGSIVVNAPNNPTSYTLLLPGNDGTANYFLQTDGAGTTTWAQAALAGNNTDLTSLNPTGNLTLGNAATTGVSVIPNGGLTMDPTGVIAVGGAATTGVSINPAGAVAISPTTGGVTFNPTGAIAIGGAATTSVSLSPTSPVTFAGTGAVSMIPTGNVTISPSGTVNVSGTNVTVNPSGFLTLAPSGALTIGSTSGVSAMTLNAGTGNITINGNVTLATAMSIQSNVTSVTLANGANNDVAIGSGTYFRVAGPTQGFSLSGMTGGADGRMVTIENGIAKAMLIATNTGSAAANQIQGQGCVLTQYGTASFTYNATLSKWVLTSCNLGSSPTQNYALSAATTYNSGAPLVTNGARIVTLPMTGNFTATLSCIALDTNNQLLPYVGQELTVIFNLNAGGGAASNMTVSHNTVCAAPGYTIKTNLAANAPGTAGNTPVMANFIFDGTSWDLIALAQ